MLFLSHFMNLISTILHMQMQEVIGVFDKKIVFVVIDQSIGNR